MGINLSAGDAFSRKGISESIQSLQTPKIIENKNIIKKTGKTEEDGNQVRGSQFLSKPETDQVVKRFEPLQPVLQKALLGNQSLRKEFQEIERLTQVRPEIFSKSSVSEGFGIKMDEIQELGRKNGLKIEEDKIFGPLALKNSNLIHEASNDAKRVNEGPPIEAGKIKQLPLVAPPQDLRDGVNNIHLLTSKTSLLGDADKPPLRGEVTGVLDVNTPLKLKTPENQEPFILGSTQKNVRLEKGVRREVSEGHLIVPSLKIESPVIPRKVDAEKDIVLDSAVRNVEKPALKNENLEQTSNPQSVNRTKTTVDSNLAPVTSPKGLNETRDIVAETIVESIFSPKVLVPQTTVQITKSNETSTTVTIQSQTVAPRPVVLLTGKDSPSPKKLEEKNRLDFDRRLREGGIQNFVVEAKQSVLLSGVHPLPPQISASEGHLAQPILLVPPDSAFKAETVARNPLHEDNRAQVLGVTEPKEVSPSLGNSKAVKTTHKDSDNPVPPLSNFEKMRRILPTNIRAKLLPIPSVNILDLVL